MATRDPQTTGVLLAVAGAALWGTTGTSQALLAGHHSPIAVGALRAVMAAVVLLGLTVVRPHGPTELRRAVTGGRWRWLLLGGVAEAVYQLTFFAAVAMTGVGVGTLVMLATAPAVSGLLGWAFQHARPSRTWLVSTVVGLFGAALLVLGSDGGHPVRVGGLALAVAAGASFATYTVVGRQAMTAGIDGLALTAGVFTVAALLLVVPLSTQDLSFVTHPRSIAVLAWLGIIATGLAYVLFQSSMRRITAATAATLALAEPMVANVLAVAVLHEPFTWVMGLGVALVLGGMALLARA